MNPKFFELPKEKQSRILSAGYKIFSYYPYKKASTSMIAQEADISKSLLFHYFTNKKDLYIYLYESAVKSLLDIINKSEANVTNDFFEKLSLSMKLKLELLSIYPYMYNFIGRAYYETDSSVVEDINILKNQMTLTNISEVKNSIDLSKFKNPDDIDTLIELICLSAEGYIYRNLNTFFIDPQKSINEFQIILDSLKTHYYKNEYLDIN